MKERNGIIILDIATVVVLMISILLLGKYAETHPFRAVVLSMSIGVVITIIRTIIIKILR